MGKMLDHVDSLVGVTTNLYSFGSCVMRWRPYWLVPAAAFLVLAGAAWVCSGCSTLTVKGNLVMNEDGTVNWLASEVMEYETSTPVPDVWGAFGDVLDHLAPKDDEPDPEDEDDGG